MEECCSFDLLLRRRAPPALPCEKTIRSSTRLPPRSYFDLSSFAQVQQQFLSNSLWIITDSSPAATPYISTTYLLQNWQEYTKNDWRVKHAVPLGQWEQRHRMNPNSGPAHRHNHYKDYLWWLHSVSRVSIKPPRYTEPIEDCEDTDDDDDIVDEYDEIIHAGV